MANGLFSPRSLFRAPRPSIDEGAKKTARDDSFEGQHHVGARPWRIASQRAPPQRGVFYQAAEAQQRIVLAHFR